ncbi:MAG: hypothetical protein AB7O24_04965 [Kofleriaceae bacterium]
MERRILGIAASSALAATFVGGCARTTVSVTRGELLRHVRELRTEGRATVEVVPDGNYELRADDAFKVEVKSCDASGACKSEPRTMRIAELIANCPDAPAQHPSDVAPGCVLMETRTSRFTIGRRLHSTIDGSDFEFLGVVVFVVLPMAVVIGVVKYLTCNDDPRFNRPC